MGNKIKVVFVINTITHYQLQFLNFLRRFLDIRVLFHSKNHKNYEFSYQRKNFIYFIEEYKNKNLFIKKIIHDFKPKFLILGGYKLKYNSIIIKYIKNLRIRYLYWLERFDKDKKIKLKIIQLLIRNILFKADGILSVGKEAERFYKQYNKNTCNLPYSIEINKLNKKKNFNNNKINFLFVGQLIKRKGLDLVLNVINNLNTETQNKIFFTIVGNGKLSKEIKFLEHTKRNVKYYSFQNINKLNKLYLRNDVLLFPSRFDGWGVVPMEAMSNAMLIISSKNCGANEIIKKNKGNIIISSNTKDLTGAIIKCVKKKSSIKRLGIINRNLIINSIYNVKNSSKLLSEYLNKYDNRN
jgi:glycosyltransferase involved in cell wall biosynthesis